MEPKFVTPQLAVEYLMMIHRQREPLRARQALLSRLREGIIEWRCGRWREIYVDENDAIFDESGDWTSEEPKCGFPPSFWVEALAHDNVFWSTNIFTASGAVDFYSAPRNVAQWLARNGYGIARWMRSADDVTVCLDHVQETMTGPGWSAGGSVTHDRPFPRSMANHYRQALIGLIARAVDDGEAIRSNTRACVEEAFDATGTIPDATDIKRLSKEISEALSGDFEAPAN